MASTFRFARDKGGDTIRTWTGTMARFVLFYYRELFFSKLSRPSGERLYRKIGKL